LYENPRKNALANRGKMIKMLNVLVKKTTKKNLPYKKKKQKKEELINCISR
jgi:hypothetical protein